MAKYGIKVQWQNETSHFDRANHTSGLRPARTSRLAILSQPLVVTSARPSDHTLQLPQAIHRPFAVAGRNDSPDLGPTKILKITIVKAVQNSG